MSSARRAVYNTAAMSIFEPEREAGQRSREAAEMAAEQRESKEGEPDEELKAAAAMERADYLVREVKSSQTQMQNIILHMQQVLAAIRALRDELQLSPEDDPASVSQDRARVEALKKRIAAYTDELLKMKGELIREQAEVLRAGEGQTMSGQMLKQKAEAMVEELLAEIQS